MAGPDRRAAADRRCRGPGRGGRDVRVRGCGGGSRCAWQRASERRRGARRAGLGGEALSDGAELVRRLREVAPHAVIAAVPAPDGAAARTGRRGARSGRGRIHRFRLQPTWRRGRTRWRSSGGGAGGRCRHGPRGAARRAVRPPAARRVPSETARSRRWDEHGEPLGVISAAGEWPDRASGVVITPGDVSARWDAARLRAVGTARRPERVAMRAAVLGAGRDGAQHRQGAAARRSPGGAVLAHRADAARRGRALEREAAAQITYTTSIGEAADRRRADHRVGPRVAGSEGAGAARGGVGGAGPRR